MVWKGPNSLHKKGWVFAHLSSLCLEAILVVGAFPPPHTELELRWLFRAKNSGKSNRPSDSGEKKAHKLKKNLWDTGRVSPGTPCGTNRGLPASVPEFRYYLLFALEKRTEKSIFAVTPAGDTRPSRGLQKIYVIFSYVPFLFLVITG